MNPSRLLDRPYSQEELTKFREMLSKMKTYKDGMIHYTEYHPFLQMIGIPATPAQVETYNTYFRAPYGDEFCRVDDIIKILASLHDAKVLALTCAKHFDRNGDGVISKEEYDVGIVAMIAYDPTAFGEKGKISFDEFLEVADTNRDGKLQVEELAEWFNKK